MTVEEAARFVRNAEGKPGAEVDEEKLAEAIAVLQEAEEAALSDAPLVHRTVPKMLFDLVTFPLRGDRLPKSPTEWARWVGSLGSEKMIEAVVSRLGSWLRGGIDEAIPDILGFLPASRHPQGSDPVSYPWETPGTSSRPKPRRDPSRLAEATIDTVEEAKAFVVDAEKDTDAPVDPVDAGAAVAILTAADLPEAEWRRWTGRARAVALRAGGAPGAPAVSQGAVDVDGEDAARASIPTDLRTRLSNAAVNLAISPLEVENWIEEAFEAAGFDPAGAVGLLEALAERWEEEAMALLPAPIAVDRDFAAVREVGFETVDLGFGGEGVRARRSTQEVAPRYFEGDQLAPAGLDQASISRIQRRLVAAGLLEEANIWLGFWDSASQKAYETALGFANQQGKTADQVISEMAANLPESVREARAQAERSRQFQAPPFLAPDPAALANLVQDRARSELGRDLSPSEVAELTSTLTAGFRAQHEARVAADRAAFEAQTALGETGVPQTPGTFGDVDPVARFRQVFESRFGPEIGFREGQAEVRENMNNVFESLRTMSSLIGP